MHKMHGSSMQVSHMFKLFLKFYFILFYLSDLTDDSIHSFYAALTNEIEVNINNDTK